MSHPLPSGSLASAKAQSVTPLRKHRKLLKDGSGCEVWPEDVESLFVQGLRAYWHSPWATYSRGRSRWRNQFLVDYLEKAGVIRTKKQVASHIQVLRNMWKTEAELQLVSNGDEAMADTLLSAVKKEELFDLPASPSGTLSSASSPNFSPEEFRSDVPPSPMPYVKGEPYSPSTQLAFPNESVCSSPSSSNWDYGLPTSPPTRGTCALPSTASAQPSYPKHISRPGHVHHPYKPAPQPAPGSGSPSMQAYGPNRATSFVLSAEGMSSLVINIDALPNVPGAHAGGRPAPAMLKIRPSIPAVEDPRNPALQGFSGKVSFACVWTFHAKCITKVFAGGACLSEDTAALDPTNIEFGTAHTVLPDSALTRCRLFDTARNVITQEIIIDNELLLCVVYELDRRSRGGLPSAQLTGYQKSTAVPPPTSFSRPLAYSYPTPHSQYALQSRPAVQTSISDALIPAAGMKYRTATY